MLTEVHEASCACGHSHLCTFTPGDPYRVDKWLAGWTRPIVAPTGWTRRSEVFRHYVAWCERDGVTALGERRFFSRLRALGVQEHKNSVVQMNLRLLTPGTG